MGSGKDSTRADNMFMNLENEEMHLVCRVIKRNIK
jgi:hypothetical protein